MSLHGFGDAGENAWGIAIYLRFYNNISKLSQTCLMYSTTRVVPTKGKLRIPTKELNAALLVREKLFYIAKSLAVPTTNFYTHIDSLTCINALDKQKLK